MNLYVTDRINYYHKVGIAEQLSERMMAYHTLVPDLEVAYSVNLPKKIAKSMEKLIKKTIGHYAVFKNGRKTECYNLKLNDIKKVILNVSAFLKYPLINIRFLNTSYGGSHTTRKSDRKIFERRINYDDHFFVYLDKLYFGKYIPLMTIEKISPKKVKIDLINNITLEKLRKKANWMEEYLVDFRLSNPLFEKLKNYNEFLLSNSSMKKIISFLEKIIFEAIKGYAHENASRMPLLKVSIINPQKPLRNIQLTSVTQNFKYFNFDKFKSLSDS